MEILFPYLEKKKQELKLHVDLNYPALVIFDRFQGQWTENILALLEAKRVLLAVVPANYSDRLHKAIGCQCQQTVHRIPSQPVSRMVLRTNLPATTDVQGDCTASS